jgi:hypothetical protein
MAGAAQLDVRHLQEKTHLSPLAPKLLCRSRRRRRRKDTTNGSRGAIESVGEPAQGRANVSVVRPLISNSSCFTLLHGALARPVRPYNAQSLSVYARPITAGSKLLSRAGCAPDGWMTSLGVRVCVRVCERAPLKRALSSAIDCRQIELSAFMFGYLIAAAGPAGRRAGPLASLARALAQRPKTFQF